MSDDAPMTRNRELIRTVLLIQTGMLALLTAEASLIAAVGVGSPISAMLTAAALIFVGDAARTGKLTRRLKWTERILIGTFAIDLVISAITALAVPEPTVWISRMLIPTFVLLATRRSRESASPVEAQPSQLVAV